MTHEPESRARKAVAMEHNSELSREVQTSSSFANGNNNTEDTYSKQTDLGDGLQTELRSLRDALWEAINGIEEKAPGVPIERELIILDHLAERLGNIIYETEAESMRCGLEERKPK